VIVLLQCADGCVHPAAVRARHRLMARWRAGRLIRDLAAGRCPDASRLHALRARRLLQPRGRLALARSLDAAIHEAAARPSRPLAAVSVHREHVLLARPQLEALAERLRTPDPVSVQGLAMVDQLVTDGAGPLYYATCAAELLSACDTARIALDSA
jgi:hypothetical protein